MLNEIEKTNLFNEESMKYMHISNLFFDHPLNENELIELKKILCSINSITQMYFSGTVDIKTIEIVKYLLEISPTINDNRIEKYILVDLPEKKELFDLSFKNPLSWKISYLKNKNTYKTTDILKYRMIENVINNIVSDIKSKNLSQLESMIIVYDYVKLYDYGSESILPDIISNKKASSYGYNTLFKEILTRLNIKAFIDQTITSDNSIAYMTLVNINDEKYDVNGMYFFDPSSDSILKDEYGNDEIRKLNYNFFCINLKKFNENILEDKLGGIFSCLSHDYEYDKEKLNISLIEKKKLKDLNDTFNMDFKSIHSQMKNSKVLPNNVILDLLITNINFEYWKKNDINIKEKIIENYFEREEKLFKKTKDKYSYK